MAASNCDHCRKKGVRRPFGPRDSRQFSARRFDICGFRAYTRLHSIFFPACPPGRLTHPFLPLFSFLLLSFFLSSSRSYLRSPSISTPTANPLSSSVPRPWLLLISSFSPLRPRFLPINLRTRRSSRDF